VKEQKFLTLVQGDLLVLDYERRFYNLFTFASYYVPPNQRKIERLQDGLS
jgi:hypothetical protein